MKPRTQIEREVVKLSHSLCARKRELKRAIKNLQNEKCGNYYHVIAEVKGDFQVFRYFRISIHKRKPSTSWETQQLWYGRGREILIGRKRTMGWYYDNYAKDSDLELRHNYRNYAYNTAKMMPISTSECKSLLPMFDEEEVNRIGRLSSVAKTYTMFCASPYMETLYFQHREVFEKFLDKVQLNDILENEKEIKVALRHHYKFEDVSIWTDTMRLAKHFGIETRNPFYCAPLNLDVLHNSLLKRKAKEEAAKEIEKLAEFEGAYYKHIKPYLDILLKGANVVIMPLKSVKEVYLEGKMMHHCVYELKYWQKNDTLLLSAQVDGKHVETIEFNLKELKVIQSRGLQNKPSQYHEEILSIIQQGKKEIKSLMRKAA